MAIFHNQHPKSPLKVENIRIRATTESDIGTLAEMLATAAMPLRNGGFRAKMQHLWARSDIEQLLNVRLQAMREGKKQLQKCESILQPSSSSDDEGVVPRERLSVLWQSDSFRKLVSKASADTGEDNVWRHHNLAIPPNSETWVQHAQLTATISGTIVGFCEIAMLANPVATSPCCCSDGETSTDTSYVTTKQQQFSPAIMNLCVDSHFRRQGIASRLLKSAERLVRRQWKSESFCLAIGLYVERNNEAAVALYKSLGYKIQATCPGGDVLGEMYYMLKDLSSEVPSPCAEKDRQLSTETTLLHTHRI
jgi:ribosomal protein S18 acetylase RimI-like enzyme